MPQSAKSSLTAGLQAAHSPILEASQLIHNYDILAASTGTATWKVTSCSDHTTKFWAGNANDSRNHLFQGIVLLLKYGLISSIRQEHFCLHCRYCNIFVVLPLDIVFLGMLGSPMPHEAINQKRWPMKTKAAKSLLVRCKFCNCITCNKH